MNDISKNRLRLIQQIEELPTLPIISQKIIEVVTDKNASFNDLARIIEKDQSLAVKMLKVANSAFYGFLSKVSSLEHALVLLGADEVKSIVLGLSVYQFFSYKKDDSFDLSNIWKHAVLCSQIAKLLGTHFNLRDDDSFFLAGLIHDIGKVVIDQYFHEEFLRIIEYISVNTTTFSKAEKSILGVTHYQIAAKLLKQWRFPNKVIIQILYHHAPWYDKNYETNSIILYLANIFTKLAGYPCHPNEKQIKLDEFAHSSEIDFIIKSGFDLDYETMKKLLGHIQECIEDEADSVIRLLQ